MPMADAMSSRLPQPNNPYTNVRLSSSIPHPRRNRSTIQHSSQQKTLPGFCFIHNGLWLKKPYFHLEVNISNLDFLSKEDPHM